MKDDKNTRNFIAEMKPKLLPLKINRNLAIDGVRIGIGLEFGTYRIEFELDQRPGEVEDVADPLADHLRQNVRQGIADGFDDHVRPV